MGSSSSPPSCANVQQVAIAAVNLLAALRHGNSVRLGIVETVLARLQRPLAPRHDDLQLRSQRLIGVLEANLVVALAGAAMGYGRRALTQRNFSTWYFAITGRASDVPSRYLCSYTAPAWIAGKT